MKKLFTGDFKTELVVFVLVDGADLTDPAELCSRAKNNREEGCSNSVFSINLKSFSCPDYFNSSSM